MSNFLSRHAGRRACAFLLGCLASVAAQAAEDAGPVRAVVDATIRPLMARYDIPGMAVAVTIDERVQVFDYGVASKESGTPVGAATRFEVGSISKTLTATLATYAQATGRLSLADHPGRYVPQLRGRAIDRATLVELGAYTAGGLPLQFPDAVGDGDDAAIAYLAAWKPGTAPGTQREYSNPSLGLLGYATGVAMKDGFVSSMETQLLPRLGMRQTHIRMPADAVVDYAMGYRSGKAVHASPGPFDAETYGIKTTAADLIRFVQANIDPSPLEPALRRAVEATHVGYFQAGTLVQGLGWEQYPWPVSRETLLGGNSDEMIGDPTPVVRLAPHAPTSPRVYNKTGSTGGFGAYVAFIPSRRVGLVMLANRNYPIPARVEAAYAILQKLASPPDLDPTTANP
jgi:beta-lactamase class C